MKKMNQINNNEKSIFLTFDEDWACDGVLDFFYQMIDNMDLRVTFHVTHRSEILLKFINDERIELGIHPNFNLQLNGEMKCSKEEIINDLLDIIPDAKVLRSHSLVSSTPLSSLFSEKGIKYELNNYIPPLPGNVMSFWRFGNITRVPFIFEDDLYMSETFKPPVDYYLGNDFNMPLVFNFHPIHLFLNCEDISRYNNAKKFYKDFNMLKQHVNPNYGIKSFFEELVSKGKSKGYCFKKISEIE